MADDGMILNFAATESIPTTVQKFKGGSWKDRLKARKTARGQWTNSEGDGRGASWKNKDSVNHIPVHKPRTDSFPDERPTKRRRENGYNAKGDDTSQSVPRKPQASDKRPLEKGVVSSLFTSNPKSAVSNTKPSEQEDEEKPTQPSNAPLIDGIDTFTSLGLSTAVAAHLLTKMSLKNPTAIQKAAVSQMLKEEGDAFIQSETGSGKTLAYLLPLVQRIMSMAEHEGLVDHESGKLHRDSGLFAIVLAPTRELAKQISVVLERLLGCANYIVAGTVIGGEKKKSEKARLRKGLNILVATPGRLVDHLDNTEVLDVSHVRWLVLDEGDRLVDMGFEEDITKIVRALDQKKRRSTVPGLPESRTTVLCSATLKMDVQKLGDISLKNATLIRGEADEAEETSKTPNSAFLAPTQLKQSYMVVPSKLRLVTLTALLKRTFARKGSVMKAIIFLSCADSVDFHFKVFTRRPADAGDPENSKNSDTDEDSPPLLADTPECIAPSPLLSTNPGDPLALYRLHGSLPQATRTSIVKSFSTSTTPSLLLATDVASRGLDLPNLDLVIEYDPAFSSDDHLHRIGRTARLGRDGRATIFLLPGREEDYVDVLKSSFKKDGEGVRGNVTRTDSDDVLRKGFAPAAGVVGQRGKEWEVKATDFQLDIERWVLADDGNRDLARKAFQSHVRAYATHIGAERKYFDIKELHLGHLAKSFGLRDAPAHMNVAGMRGKDGKGKGRRVTGGEGVAWAQGGSKSDEVRDRGRSEEEAAKKKMKEMVRNRKMMMGGGADEFNLA